MAGTIKVDSINADSNLALKIANTAVAFIDATGLRPTSGNVNLDATATSKLYLPSANTVAIQTAGVTAVTVDSSQNVTLAGTLTTTGITNSGVATATRFNPTGSSATGTGMYLPAANSLGLSTNGTNAVYINSSQNVGIGTASPTAKLTVVTSNDSEGEVRLGDNATYYGSLRRVNASDELRLGNYGGSQNITFYTVASERMRIDSSGNLLVGATSPSVTSSLQVKRSGGNPVAVHNNGGTSGYFNQILFLNNAGTADIGYIARTNDNSVAYNTTSDYRLKENIAPMTGALAKVVQLKPVTYKWKINGADGQGFIAHELAEVVPDCVTGAKDATEVVVIEDKEGNIISQETKPVYQGVDTSFLVATLTAAIQELKAINDTLTARIVALENR